MEEKNNQVEEKKDGRKQPKANAKHRRRKTNRFLIDRIWFENYGHNSWLTMKEVRESGPHVESHPEELGLELSCKLYSCENLALELDSYHLFHKFFFAHLDFPPLFKPMSTPDFNEHFLWRPRWSGCGLHSRKLDNLNGIPNSPANRAYIRHIYSELGYLDDRFDKKWNDRATFILTQHGFVFCEEIYRVFLVCFEKLTRKQVQTDLNTKSKKRNHLYDLCLYEIRPFLFPI